MNSDPPSRSLVLEAACALLIARVSLWFFPLVGAWVIRARRAEDPAPPKPLQQHIKYAVLSAARYVPWHSVCLPNAIAGKLLLLRRGYSSTIHLAAGASARRFSAHAWLETDGDIILGEDGIGDLGHFL